MTCSIIKKSSHQRRQTVRSPNSSSQSTSCWRSGQQQQSAAAQAQQQQQQANNSQMIIPADRVSSSSSPSAHANATALDSHRHMSSAERREMRRLATLLPAHLRVQKPHTQPAMLVNNAAHYIAQLTATIVARVQNGTLPGDVLCQIFDGIPPSAAAAAADEAAELGGATRRRRHHHLRSPLPSSRRRRRASHGGRPYWQLVARPKGKRKNSADGTRK